MLFLCYFPLVYLQVRIHSQLLTDISTSPAPEFFETKPQEPDGFGVFQQEGQHIFGGGETLQIDWWTRWTLRPFIRKGPMCCPVLMGKECLGIPDHFSWNDLFYKKEYQSQRRSLLYCIFQHPLCKNMKSNPANPTCLMRTSTFPLGILLFRSK